MKQRSTPTIEAHIQKPVIKYARKSLGLMCTKMDIRNAGGIPDYLIWMPRGLLLLIEFKKPNGVPTPLQVEMHKRLRTLGYEVYVIDNVETGKELLRRVLHERLQESSVGAVVVPEEVHGKVVITSQRRRLARPRTR
jgi:hypothetical protein